MRAQALPIKTIVLVLLAILVGAVVLMFYFGYVAKGKTGIGGYTAVSTCNQLCTKAKSIASGLDNCTSTSSSTFNFYCSESFTEAGDTYYCDHYITCELTFADGSKGILSCSGNSASLTCSS